MADAEFENTIELSRFYMRLTGVWPDAKYSSLKMFAFTFLFLFFGLIPEMAYFIFAKDDLNDVLVMTYLGFIVTLISFCKQVNQYYRKQGKIFRTYFMKYSASKDNPCDVHVI